MSIRKKQRQSVSSLSSAVSKAKKQLLASPNDFLGLLQSLQQISNEVQLRRIERDLGAIDQVDRQYGGRLFVGEGKRAEQHALAYMQSYFDANARLLDDLAEMSCRMRLADDVASMVRMQVADHQRMSEAKQPDVESKTDRLGAEEAEALKRLLKSFTEIKSKGIKQGTSIKSDLSSTDTKKQP